MPAFGPQLRGATVTDADIAVLQNRWFILRRRNPATGRFDPTGKRAVSSVIRTPTVDMPGLVSFFAFNHEVTWPRDRYGAKMGTVEYRLSTDGGTTYYYWDGGAWSVAGAGDFCTKEDFDTNCATFPINAARSLVWEIELGSDAKNRKTPAWGGCWVSCEITDRPWDDIQVSIERHLTNNLAATLHLEQEIDDTVSKFVIGTEMTVASVQAVYNLTDDPSRSTNLYSSYDSETRKITMSGAQDRGSRLDIEYTGSPAIRVNISEADLFDGTVPAVAALIPSMSERLELSNRRDFEISEGRGKVRTRPGATKHEVLVNLFAMASNEEDAINLAKELRDVFRHVPVVYVPTGEQMPLISYQEMRSQDVVASGLYVKSADAMLLARQHRPQADSSERQMIHTIRLYVAGDTIDLDRNPEN